MPFAQPGKRKYMTLRNSMEETLAEAAEYCSVALLDIQELQISRNPDYSPLLTTLATIMANLGDARNLNSELLSRYGSEGDTTPVGDQIEELRARLNQLWRDFYQGADDVPTTHQPGERSP